MSPQKQWQKKDSLAKTLQYVLGLRPDEFGLYPDAAGFVTVKDLLRALHDEEGLRWVREGALNELHNQPGGQSPLDRQDNLIRLRPDLADLPPHQPEPGRPPKLLYVAFRSQAWPRIAENGVGPRAGEAFLKLWTDQTMALKVGLRQDPETALVTVRVEVAQKAGVIFRPYSDILWLAEGLTPPLALSGPKIKPRPEGEAPARPAPKAADRPGGFFPQPGAALVPVKGKQEGKQGDRPDWKKQTRRERRRGGSDQGKW